MGGWERRRNECAQRWWRLHVCIAETHIQETHMHAHSIQEEIVIRPPDHPAALIPLCYLNKVAPWAIWPAVHQSVQTLPRFPRLPPAGHLRLLLSSLQWLSIYPSPQLIDLHSSMLSSCHIQSLTPAWSNIFKAMCYQKEYCATHGLHLNCGEVNFRL